MLIWTGSESSYFFFEILLPSRHGHLFWTSQHLSETTAEYVLLWQHLLAPYTAKIQLWLTETRGKWFYCPVELWKEVVNSVAFSDGECHNFLTFLYLRIKLFTGGHQFWSSQSECSTSTALWNCGRKTDNRKGGAKTRPWKCGWKNTRAGGTPVDNLLCAFIFFRNGVIVADFFAAAVEDRFANFNEVQTV